MAMPAVMFPVYAPEHDDIADLDLQLLEDYGLEDLELFNENGEDGVSLDGDKTDDSTVQTKESKSDAGSSSGETVASVGVKRRKTGAPRRKSEEQMERRRERNRILARKTRLRKKFFFESLQKQVMDLKRENTLLKNIVKKKMTEAAPELLSKCSVELPSIVTESMAEATSILERSDFNLVNALQTAQQSFVVTDPSLVDNPIVFASQGFLDITGYRMDQVLGRNCRFLQGPETDQAAVDEIRKAVSEGRDTSVCLLNYKADGTPFWNQFFVAPLRDLNKNVVYYVGAQCVIDKPVDTSVPSTGIEPEAC